jgi:hypothetical protein
MLRSEVLNKILELYSRPTYLEIGVDSGTTFFAISAFKKIAVDPAFKFRVPQSTELSDNVVFHSMPSDQFFATASRDQLFDLVFIDGLHTFEQTLRDFVNATYFIKPNGVIVIDDVIPSSYYASISSLELSARVRTATKGIDGDWMGDVYKLVYFIETFFQQYSFATVAENHGQTVVWQRSRAANAVVDRTVEEIARIDYGQIVLNGPFRLAPFLKILEEVKKRVEEA